MKGIYLNKIKDTHGDEVGWILLVGNSRDFIGRSCLSVKSSLSCTLLLRLAWLACRLYC